MDNRQRLHDLLVKTYAEVFDMTEQDVLRQKRVIGQAPATFKMTYPCIRYNLDKSSTIHADNESYHFKDYWNVTVLTTDAETPLFRAIQRLPHASFDRQYVADNLYHYVFTVLY